MGKKLIKRILSNKTGATAIEYALIAGLISIAIVAGATLIGGTLDTTFTEINSAF